MKVCHIITDLGVGGAEITLYQLLSHTDDAWRDTKVVSLTGGGPLSEQLDAINIQTRTLDMKRNFPNPMSIFKLARWLRRDNPDLIQTWMYHANLIGGIAAKLAGNIPVVWGIHSSDSSSSSRRAATIWVIKVSAYLSKLLPDRIVYVSNASKKIHEQAGYVQAKGLLIPNGFDTKEFMPDRDIRADMRKQFSIPPDTFVIGLVARWHPEKDHANFFSAAGILARRKANVKFVLCGENVTSDNFELMKMIESNCVRSKTRLLGLRRDIKRIMLMLDVNTISSNAGESFPLVVGEAMASGIPCVVTDVGECANMVGETGRVVPHSNPEALAAAWQEILELPESKRQELGRQAQEHIVQNFDINRVVGEYQDLYLNVVEGH